MLIIQTILLSSVFPDCVQHLFVGDNALGGVYDCNAVRNFTNRRVADVNHLLTSDMMIERRNTSLWKSVMIFSAMAMALSP
jgi:hypothetical protein